jgi:hypothetical protein
LYVYTRFSFTGQFTVLMKLRLCVIERIKLQMEYCILNKVSVDPSLMGGFTSPTFTEHFTTQCYLVDKYTVTAIWYTMKNFWSAFTFNIKPLHSQRPYINSVTHSPWSILCALQASNYFWGDHNCKDKGLYHVFNYRASWLMHFLMA